MNSIPIISMMDKKEYIKKYAIDLVIKKEYCSYSLLRKLKSKFPKDIKLDKEVIKELKSSKVIDDYDYINSYIYKMISKYKGSKYIEYKLENIGFSSKYIKSNLCKYYDLEEKYLLLYITNNPSLASKSLVSKLVSKGYRNELIYKHVMCYNLNGDNND